jgi:hypothetical protein
MPLVNRTVRSLIELKSIENLIIIIKRRSTAMLMPSILQKSGSWLDVIVKRELAFLRAGGICYFVAFQVCICVYELIAKVWLEIAPIIF